MKLKDAILQLGSDKAVEVAREAAQELNVDWDSGAKIVFNAIVIDPDRAPKRAGSTTDTAAAAIHKWMQKYHSGFEGRASKRTSKKSRTIPDPMVTKIIKARLAHLSACDLKAVTSAHRIAMAAENILGSILENYLATNLQDYGWYCAWGETVRAVDFVHSDGALLQIKNRSNSENSSSRSIRDGTAIKKWYRVEANHKKYMWDQLNDICGTTHLAEDAFAQFAEDLIMANPACLAIEVGSHWTV